MNGRPTILPISGQDRVRFTPPSAENDDPKPVYILAVPTVREQAALTRDLAVEGLEYPSDERLTHLAEQGIGEIVDEDQRPQLMEIAAQYRDLLARAPEAEGEAVEGTVETRPDDADPGEVIDEGSAPDPDAELKAEYLQIEEFMAAHYRPYREAMALRGQFIAVAPYLIAARYLRGWDGLGVPFRRGAAGVPDDLLAQLPPGHLIEIMVEVNRLSHLGRAERGNSRSPSRSRAGRKNSKRA